jgi:hypothetical protein
VLRCAAETLRGPQNRLEVSIAAITLVPDPVRCPMGIHLWLEICELAGADFVLDVDAE